MKSDVYALIWSGDWLPWLESTCLRHQFSELFSILFIRTKLLWSNHCAVLRMRSSYSGEFKSHERASTPSVHLCKNMTVTIFNITTRRACMRAVSVLNAEMSLTTLAARIIVHIQTRANVFQVLWTYFKFCEHISYSLVLQTWISTVFVHICLLQIKDAQIIKTQ